jgi:hypothetical protein
MKRLSTGPFIDLLIPLLLLAPIALVLAPQGVPNTADGWVHILRAGEWMRSWQEGVLIPRWSPNLGRGYGLPIYVFAPPLPYLWTAFYTQFGLSVELAYKAMLFTAVLVGGFGAYRLSRSLLGRMAGAVGLAAFVYAPIFLRELLIQGNAPQLWAWACAPWAAWGVISLYRELRVRKVLGLAVAIAGVIFGHVAAAIIMLGMVSTMGAALWVVTRRWRALAAVVGGILLGLALSAWLWLPQQMEGRYVRLDRIVASDFRPRLIPLHELLALSPRLDTGATNPYFPLTLGAVQVGIACCALLLLLLIGSVMVLKRRSVAVDNLTVGVGVYFVGFALFCGFMATKWAEPLWEVLPLLDKFQWPFRWHGFTAVGLSWLCAFAVTAPVWLLAPHLQRTGVALVSNTLGGVALIWLMGSALVNLYPSNLPLGTVGTTPFDAVDFEIRTGTLGTTSLGEYDPIWTGEQLRTLPPPPEYEEETWPVNRLPTPLPAGVSGSHEVAQGQHHRFRLQLTQPATLTLKLLYFPGWTATLDGEPITLQPHPDNGLIDVALPAGEHTLSLTFQGTPLRRMANAISGVSWILLLGLWVIALVRAGWPGRSASTARWVTEEGGQPAIVALACVLVLMAVRTLVPGWLQVHTAPGDVPPGVTPVPAIFANQVQLLGADALPETIRAGERLRVVTYWRAQERLPQDYGIFLHVDDWNGETIVAANERHPGEIPTSDWLPERYIRSPLQLLLPPDLPPLRYRVRVGLLHWETGAWLPSDQGDDVEVGQFWVEAQEPEQAPGETIAHFGPSIRLVGVEYEPTQALLTLYWQTDSAIAQDATIFVHALAADGQLLGQRDAAPYDNRYPTSAWRPGQVIADVRPLAPLVADVAQIDHFLVGLYDPTTGVRLPATDGAGNPLADQALRIEANSAQFSN